ncbi:MAG: PAS domain S-box protein, partial [Chloroflexota bacterium]
MKNNSTINRFFPDILGDGTDENILGIIKIITICNIIYLPLLIFGNLIGGKTPIGVYILDIIGIILSVILWWTSTKENAKLGVVFILIGGYFIFTLVCAQLGTIRNPTTTGYLFLVFLAGLAYGLPGIIISCIICSASILGLIIAEQYHFLPKPDFSVSATQWITFSAWFVLMGSVSYVSQKSVKNSLILAYREIEEKKKITDELSLSEKRYRLISENAADVIWVLDFTTAKLTYISPSIYKLLGLHTEEVIDQPIHSLLTPGSYQHFIEKVQEQINYFTRDNKLNSFLDEFDQVHKNGSIISTEIKSSLIFNNNGGIDIISVSRDIAERKTQE